MSKTIILENIDRVIKAIEVQQNNLHLLKQGITIFKGDIKTRLKKQRWMC